MEEGAGHSNLSGPAWQALQSLDPTAEDEAALTLAACLALAEQRFLLLYRQGLTRFGEPDGRELGAEADILGDAHPPLRLPADSLPVTSPPMLGALERVRRAVGG